MSDTLPPRPEYTNGQYIGADDLNAGVVYARDESRRQALSGRTWGIAAGLALVEIADATGATQMYIEPGIAWDGYGRPIVVLSPAPVTTDLFAALGTGNWTVWLRYNAVPTQMVSPGFLTCGGGDPATRIAETWQIVAGAPASTNDGVILNGVTVADPRDMLKAFDTLAPVVLDGSVPYQSFPDDTANWLVPVGIVSYVTGTPGRFVARTPDQLMQNRLGRRYIGAVAESVFAADGVLRLRDRQTDQQTANGTIVADATLDANAAIQTGDMGFDPATGTPIREVGNELVWVEGNLRVMGDARLFGGQLSLRATDGTEPAGSMFLRRDNPDPKAVAPRNLEISIGQPPQGQAVNRMLVAPSTNGTLATPPALSVGADNRVGINVAVPATGLTLDVNGDFGHIGDPTKIFLNNSTVSDTNGTLLLIAGAGTIELGADGQLTHVGIGTNAPQGDTALDVHGGGIAVNDPNAFLRLLGSQIMDLDDGRLRIRSGGGVVTFDGNDLVGIGTQNPTAMLDVNGNANVQTGLHAGSVDTNGLAVHGNASVAGAITATGPIAVNGAATSSLSLLGSLLADFDDGILRIRSGGSTVSFDGGDNVCIGTTAPVEALTVNGNVWVTGWVNAVGGYFAGPSDARLKQNIQPLKNALARLLSLQGVEFDWSRPDLAAAMPGRQVGMVADQVQTVFPQWVRTDKDSGMKMLGPRGFEALAVEALRELTNRVSALEAETQRLNQLLAQRAERPPAPAPAASASSTRRGASPSKKSS